MSLVAERTREDGLKTMLSNSSLSSFITSPTSQPATGNVVLSQPDAQQSQGEFQSWEEGFTKRLRDAAKLTSQAAEELFLPERSVLALDRIAYNPEFASKLATSIKDIQSARSKLDRYGSLAGRLRGGLARRAGMVSLTGRIGGIKTEDLGENLISCVERGDISSVLSVDHELKELLEAVTKNEVELDETMRMLSILDRYEKGGEGDSIPEGASRQDSMNSLVLHPTYSANRDQSSLQKRTTSSSSAMAASQDTSGTDPLLDRLEDWASGRPLDGLTRVQRGTLSSLKQDTDATKERIEHLRLTTVLFRARNQIQTLKSAGNLINVGRKASTNRTLESELIEALEDDDARSVFSAIAAADQMRNNKSDENITPEDLRAASAMLGRVANALESANASEEPLTSNAVSRLR